MAVSTTGSPQVALSAQSFPSGGLAKALFAGNLRFSGASAVSAPPAKIPLNAVLSWNDYQDLLNTNPKILRNAAQRTFDMVLSHGTDKAVIEGGETIYTYNLFDRPSNPENALYGMNKPIAQLMQSLRAAAAGSSSANKVVLMVGPVGTAKSTICSILKNGFEDYARTDEGAMFGLQFDLSDPALDALKEKGGKLYGLGKTFDSPMNEDPISLLGRDEMRARYSELNGILRQQAEASGKPVGYELIARDTLSPTGQYVFDALVEHYGDAKTVLEKCVKAKRIIPNEKAGKALGYLNAKEDKSYNEGMLVGNPNYRKVGQWGEAGHPLAFAYDGVLNKGNRGIVQLDEVIKYDASMWNTMLSAAQERMLKPGENIPAIPFDGVIIATTNIPEWERKVKKNVNAEAFRDRIIPVGVPYNARIKDEMRIHKKIWENACRRAGVFPSRHTTHVAALLSVMTRLAPPKNSSLNLMDKARLYDGQVIDQNITGQKIDQERKDAPQWELYKGLSPRTIGDVLDKAMTFTDAVETRTVTPFQFIKAFEALLDDPQCTLLDDDKAKYRQILGSVSEEVDRLYKLDVKRAIAGDEAKMKDHFDRYITHIGAARRGEEVKNPITGRYEKVDEAFMKAVEAECGVTDSIRKQFRDELWSLKGDLGDKFNFKSDAKLRRGLEEYLMKNSDLNVPPQMLNRGQSADEETRKKIGTIKQRLIDLPDEDGYGKYNEVSAEVAMSRANSPKSK